MQTYGRRNLALATRRVPAWATVTAARTPLYAHAIGAITHRLYRLIWKILHSDLR